MSQKNRILAGILSLLVVVGGIRLWTGFHSQPQLADSDHVFQTVDALFTAVTAHDNQRLAACETRLTACKQAGELPSAAAKRLDRVIALAHAGDWDSAAHRLYNFMQAQRRQTPAPVKPPGQTAMR